MSQVPPVRQILQDQVPGAPAWITGILFPLNRFMTAVYNCLNNGLTIGDNVRGQMKTQLTFTATASYTAQKFTCGLPPNVAPVFCQIGQISANPPMLPTDPAIALNTWSYKNGQISLDYIAGLKAGTEYTLTLLVF